MQRIYALERLTKLVEVFTTINDLSRETGIYKFSIEWIPISNFISIMVVVNGRM